MLPSLNFIIGGILFCFALFTISGAGVMLPDSRTRIGEMPEIGRPMMQRSIAEAPARAQFYMMAAARRSGELERLQARTAAEVAAAEVAAEPGKPDADEPTPTVMTEAPPGTSLADEVEAPVQVPAVRVKSDDRTDEASPPQDAALVAALAAEDGEPVPLANVPLPPARPAVFSGLHRRTRLFRRRQHVIQPYSAAQAVAAGPGVSAGPAVPASQGVAGYNPSEAESR